MCDADAHISRVENPIKFVKVRTGLMHSKQNRVYNFFQRLTIEMINQKVGLISSFVQRTLAHIKTTCYLNVSWSCMYEKGFKFGELERGIFEASHLAKIGLINVTVYIYTYASPIPIYHHLIL